jgi:intracellular multiplication protein IcmT
MKLIEVLQGFWRETGRAPRLWFFSAYIAVPLVFFLFHIRLWTFLLLVLSIAGMTVIERFGYTPPVALLALRAWIAGKVVTRRRNLLHKEINH